VCHGHGPVLGQSPVDSRAVLAEQRAASKWRLLLAFSCHCLLPGAGLLSGKKEAAPALQNIYSGTGPLRGPMALATHTHAHKIYTGVARARVRPPPQLQAPGRVGAQPPSPPPRRPSAGGPAGPPETCAPAGVPSTSLTGLATRHPAPPLSRQCATETVRRPHTA
jgi:hypothetical protein